VAPVLVWALLVGALFTPLRGWLHHEDHYDRAAMREWLEESRNPDKTLAQLVTEYHARALQYAAARRAKAPGELSLFDAGAPAAVKREEIFQHLRALGDPAMKMYPGALLLFPAVYRMEVTFDFSDAPEVADLRLGEGGGRLGAAVVWDSGQQPGKGQDRLDGFELGKYGKVRVHYQLHAWNRRQRDDQRKASRLRLLSLLAVAATGLAMVWVLRLQADERERERQRRLAQEKITQAERQLLQEERRHAETERQLLEQRLATQAAEGQALELKSHLYASIGIMAGSYAHNIKNLLVRPNDLLRRCLEAQGVPAEQERMMREVQQTLGTVTERLQQILHTVRRSPGQAEQRVLDLNEVVRVLGRTWADLAADRWQLDVAVELAGGPLWVSGDASHLQQAVENLLFNARDATFEMRSLQRDAARKVAQPDPAARRQALIQAAAWRGKVTLRTRRQAGPAGEGAVLEVIDNGAGMTEEVRRRCTETHFSTKRDNAVYEGHSTGMGLGLSFVTAILEHHRGRLQVESEPQRGSVMRVVLPLAEGPGANGQGVVVQGQPSGVRTVL
jgi:signal transduction histidine kinase